MDNRSYTQVLKSTLVDNSARLVENHQTKNVTQKLTFRLTQAWLTKWLTTHLSTHNNQSVKSLATIDNRDTDSSVYVYDHDLAVSHSVPALSNAGFEPTYANTAIPVLQEGRARDPLLATIARNIQLLTFVFNIQLSVSHIAGKNNC